MTNKLTETMTALDLSVSAVFVPWSQSRNFDKTKRPNERSLNWKVTLKLGEAGLQTLRDAASEY